MKQSQSQISVSFVSQSQSQICSQCKENPIDYQSQVQSVIDIPPEFLPYFSEQGQNQSKKTYLTSQQISEKLKVICLIGITGVGKSSTANSICGIPDNFVESAKIESCTQETTGKMFKWPEHNFSKKNENQENFKKDVPFMVVDTPGLCDNKGNDTQNIVNMVCFLKNLAYVHTFVICFNSQDPRLDENKQNILKLFSEMFGKEFFKNIVLCFTRWSYDKKEEKIRERKNCGKDSVISQISQQFLEKMDVDLSKDQFIFIDNEYSNPETRDDSDPAELEKNSEQLEILYEKTIKNKAFWCEDLKAVQKENQKLQKQIQEQLEMLKEQQLKFQEEIEKEKEQAIIKQQVIKNMAEEKQKEIEQKHILEKQEQEREKEEIEKSLLEVEKERKKEREQAIKQIQELEVSLLKYEEIEKSRIQDLSSISNILQANNNNQTQLAPSQNIFEQNNNNATSLFGTSINNNQTGGLFGTSISNNQTGGLFANFQNQQQQEQQQKQSSNLFGSANTIQESHPKKEKHNGPRCMDGSLDMRYSVNKGLRKYED